MTPSIPVFLLMGVSGTGKSTVGERLADQLNGVFLDGNDYHLATHINSMSSGIPIDDFVRKSWLRRVSGDVERMRAQKPAPIFLACSALKKSNRDFLRNDIGPLCVLHLTGEPALIRERMLARRDHFAPAALLDSQLEDLEPPVPPEADVHVIDISQSVEAIVTQVAAIVETVMERMRAGSVSG